MPHLSQIMLGRSLRCVAAEPRRAQSFEQYLAAALVGWNIFLQNPHAFGLSLRGVGWARAAHDNEQ